MGPQWEQKFQNATPPSNYLWIFSNLFWNLFSVVLVWIFEILSTIFHDFVSFSLTWDPMGVNISKRYSSLKLLLNLYNSNLFWNFFSVVHTKGMFWIFEIFSIRFFTIFFFIFVNMGPYGSHNFKTLLLPQITFESFQTFSEFSSQWSSKSTVFWFGKFWVSVFFKFTTIPYGKPKTSIIWKTSDRRTKRSEIWGSGVSVQCIK